MHTFRRVMRNGQPGYLVPSFQVGYFHPTTNNFIVLSVQDCATDAATRVNYLNGGGGACPFIQFNDEIIL